MIVTILSLTALYALHATHVNYLLTRLQDIPQIQIYG